MDVDLCLRDTVVDAGTCGDVKSEVVEDTGHTMSPL